MKDEIEPRVEMKGISNSASTTDAPDQNHVQQTAESCRKASADTSLDTTDQPGQTPCLQSKGNDENTGSLNSNDCTDAHDGAPRKDAEETQAVYGHHLGKIKAATELLSRLYLQDRRPRKADLPIIQDACIALEQMEDLKK